MQKIRDLEAGEIKARLQKDGLGLDFGSIVANLRSNVGGLANALRQVYGEFPVIPKRDFYDIHAAVLRASGLRGFMRPQINYLCDGAFAFQPLPADTHLPLLEWGLNWCIANRSHQWLLLHAGVVASGAAAILLPAVPSSGKSTLTAALMLSGFRLLSDEFALVTPESGDVVPLVRPIALKNESIDLIGGFRSAVIGPRFDGTRKGTVAHLAPNAASVAASNTPATPRLIVFPKFSAAAQARLEPISKAQAFVKLAGNSFNYELLGPTGYASVARLIISCDCFILPFSNLEYAIDALHQALERSALPAVHVLSAH